MGDVAVRLVFFDMLAERHRPCDALGMCNCDSPRAAHDPGAPQCGGTWGKRNVRVKDIKGGEYSPETDASALRYRPYKFAVTMENALVPGYVTEKPIAALLADTIPIYFGAGLSRRGGGPWLNAERMVVCDVSEDTLYALRSLERPFEPRSHVALKLYRRAKCHHKSADLHPTVWYEILCRYHRISMSNRDGFEHAHTIPYDG